MLVLFIVLWICCMFVVCQVLCELYKMVMVFTMITRITMTMRRVLIVIWPLMERNIWIYYLVLFITSVDWFLLWVFVDKPFLVSHVNFNCMLSMLENFLLYAKTSCIQINKTYRITWLENSLPHFFQFTNAVGGFFLYGEFSVCPQRWEGTVLMNFNRRLHRYVFQAPNCLITVYIEIIFVHGIY